MEEGSQFHFIDSSPVCLRGHRGLSRYQERTAKTKSRQHQTGKKRTLEQAIENVVKGEIPTGAEGWLHGGTILFELVLKGG